MNFPRSTGLIFLAGVVALGLGVFQALTIPRLSREIETAGSQLQVLRQKNERLSEILSEIKTIGDNLEVVRIALPRSEDVPNLIMQLEEVSKQSGVSVQHLGFGGVKESGEKKTGGVQKISLTAVVTGSYESLLTFLRNLEGGSRIVNVTNFRFSPVQKEGEAALTITLGVEAFYLAEVESAAPEAPLVLDTASKEYIELVRKVKALKVYRAENF